MPDATPRPDPRAEAARVPAARGRGGEAAQRIAEAAARSRELLVRSLDPQATMLSALEAVVPSLADWGVLCLPGAGDAPALRQVLHADESRGELLDRLQSFPLPRGLPAQGPRLLSDVNDAVLAGLAAPADLAILRELRPRTLALLPLAAGRERGVLVLAAGESGRRLGAEDVPLLAVLGEQIGLALFAARTVDREGRNDLARRIDDLVHDLRNHVHALTISLHLLTAADLGDADRRAQLAAMERVLRLMNERLAAAMGDDGRARTRPG